MQFFVLLNTMVAFSLFIYSMTSVFHCKKVLKLLVFLDDYEQFGSSSDPGRGAPTAIFPRDDEDPHVGDPPVQKKKEEPLEINLPEEEQKEDEKKFDTSFSEEDAKKKEIFTQLASAPKSILKSK